MRTAWTLALALVVTGGTVEATENPSDRQAAKQDRIVGTVVETLDASSYTYVLLETPQGEAWAAVPRADLEVGARVVIAHPRAMTNFESRTLGRRFDTIFFGTLEGQDASSFMSKRGVDPHGHGQDSMASSGPIEVAKAEGSTGRTVAELYAKRVDLAGKTAALRGKVVKYSAGIMGRNWIHIQDGTGEAAAGTNDITVTTTDTASVGEIVLVEGTVAVDKDFGAGYRYAVMLENASVK